MNAETNRSWAMYDPYYKNVVLNLHGDAAVGGSFVSDASTNNFTPTISGNPIANTGTALSGSRNFANGSGYFNGSTDYINFASNAAFAFGTGDFTIEAWVYTTASGRQDWFDLNNGTSANRIQFIYDGTNVAFYNNASLVAGGAYTPTLSTWTHYALVRASGTAKVYVNGTQVGSSGSSSTNFAANPVRIAHDDSTQWATGRMSNVRVVKGTAVYTGAFATPSLLPLTTDGATSAACYSSTTNVNTSFAASATSLLTLQTPNSATNNGFVDSSTNNFAITRNGNTTQGSFSPYGQGWSIYSPNSAGQGLTVATNTALNLGTGNFTIEAWVNTSSLPTSNTFTTSAGGYQSIFGSGPNSSSTGTQMYIGTTNIYFDISSDGSGPISVAHNFVANTWYHLALTRSGTTFKLFINGIEVKSGTSSSSWNDGYGFGIGCPEPVANGGYTGAWWYGYISNFRVVKGSVLYTSNFTPSTTPLTTVSGTSLLTCQSNRFVDNSASPLTITATGSTSVQRFQPFLFNTSYTPSTIGGSGYFDGTGDFLTVAAGTTALAYGTGDFDITFWCYINSLISTAAVFYDQRGSGGTDIAPLILVNVTTWRYAVAGTVRITGSAPVLNQWNFVQVSRSSGTTRMWVNGVQQGSDYTDSNNYVCPTGFPKIGGYSDDPGVSKFNGYMTDLKILKGTGYSSATTVPTAPASTTSTALCLSYTNAGIVDNAMMNDLATVGNAQISTSVKKYGTGSMYFDGSGDYLYINKNQPLTLGSGDFTVECWVYFTSVSGTQVIIDDYDSAATGWQLWINASVIKFYSGTANLLSGTTTLTTGNWYHVAVSRSGSSLKMFLNGAVEASTTSSVAYTNATNPVLIGGQAAGGPTSYLFGYIDDLRITKGVARYVANFTPPTSQLQDQ